MHVDHLTTIIVHYYNIYTNLCFADLKMFSTESQASEECADLGSQVCTLRPNKKLVLLIKILLVYI